MRIHLINLFALCLLFAACTEKKSPKQNVENQQISKEQPLVVNELADFKFHSMLANLPSPLQTFQTLQHVELTQKTIALTSIKKAAQLTTTSAKAYGYGVFMADMGFTAYQSQHQKSLEYLDVCRTLATDLGVGDVFNQTITQKFESNSGDEVVFVKMMDEAFTQIDAYMLTNERFINATEMFIGSWLESQIIANRLLLGETHKDDNLIVREGIYNQKLHTSNLVNVLAELEGQFNKEIYYSIEDIMMFYAGFGDAASITQEDLTELQIKLEALKEKLLS